MIEELVNTKYNSPNVRFLVIIMSNWTLFSNHGHVLVCLARDSEARLRDVAADVGITERAVQKIVRDLQDGGMVSVTKKGRRNRYRIHKKQSLRHELEAHCTLSDLIGIVIKASEVERLSMTDMRGSEEMSTAKSEPLDIAVESETVSVSNPRSNESTAAQPKSEKPKSEKPKSKKPKLSDIIERQQGSLF